MPSGFSRGKNIKLFRNSILERFTHVHPITPFVVWLPVVFYLIYRSSTVHELNGWVIASVLLSGLFAWTFFEYLLHRFIFHFRPMGPRTERLVFLFHGIHHDDPSDETRLVMPPLAALLLAVFVYSFWWAVLGSPWVEPFFSGFLLGYLAYDAVHFSVHRYKDSWKWGRWLVQNHMTHHYRCPEARWGVTSPLWDYVFGTTEQTVTSNKPDVA